MRQVSVSVIIPTYNRAERVREAVESVLAQSYSHRELIVVDDGSVDATASALEPFRESISTIRQENRGVSAARNAGIAKARGEWLAFLDSDDLWLPGKLSAQMDYLSQNPDLPICQTDELWIRHGQRLNPKAYHRKPSGHCFHLLLERCLVSPSAVIVHRRLFDEVGLFDESLPACEDYDLWLRIGCRHPIGLLEKPLIVKRGGHPDQLSATVPALDRYRIRSIEKLLRGGLLGDEQRRLAMAVLAKKCLIYAKGCERRGRLEEAGVIMALPVELSRELGIELNDSGSHKDHIL